MVSELPSGGWIRSRYMWSSRKEHASSLPGAMRGLENIASRWFRTRGLSTSSKYGEDGGASGLMKPPKRCVRPADASLPLVSLNAAPPSNSAVISASSAAFNLAHSSLSPQLPVDGA